MTIDGCYEVGYRSKTFKIVQYQLWYEKFLLFLVIAVKFIHMEYKQLARK